MAKFIGQSKFNCGDTVFIKIDKRGVFQGCIDQVSMHLRKNNHESISYYVIVPEQGTHSRYESMVFATPNEAFNFKG
jgi:hypothetical protein